MVLTGEISVDDDNFDEERLLRLSDPDHVVRQRRLIAAQRAEALRMRIFLDRSATRIAAPPVKIDHPVI